MDPSSVAATASVNATIGVTIPSLRPLSTLSARRSRIGTLLVVDDLGAERGIGGRQGRGDEAGERHRQIVEAPRRGERAQQQRQWEPDPEQAGREAMSLRSLTTSTRAASANSRSASVASASRWTDGASTSTASEPPVRVRQQVAGDGEDERPR